MIKTIKVQGPATFSAAATLTTDKKINLIYGLNGTGKSTVCRFLKSPEDLDYGLCEVSPTPPPQSIYVYNEDFVRENFYESDTLKGIFSLSKQNKEAEAKLTQSRKNRALLSTARETAIGTQNSRQAELLRIKQIAEEAAWKIKTSYAGGDRVLEYCLDGLKAKKETLFAHLLATKKPSKPEYDIHSLKSEAQALSASDAAFAVAIALLDLEAEDNEAHEVFKTPIIGSQHSAVSGLIQKLGNSDWVREGLDYLDTNPSDVGSQCPFCQAETITDKLVDEIRGFFDESYEANLSIVKTHLTKYRQLMDRIPRLEDLKTHPFASEKLILVLEQLRSSLQANFLLIESKSQNPSSEVELVKTSSLVSDLNSEIRDINKLVTSHNEKLQNKAKSLEEIKTRFWSLMRLDYDQTISRLLDDQREIDASLRTIGSNISEIDAQIHAQDLGIAEAQKATVNVDDAVLSINNSLLHLGIDDFSIEKHDEALYRLKRASGRGSNKFSTLSEGEKMMITLLYFCELCKGRRSAGDTTDEKIVVFDDPISSLSHIYIFNVGQLIRSTFFQSNVARQVFVFTHSLYFFYELADPKKERRDENQALFRITKSKGQSQFLSMKYEEIQNDYQAYWQVINSSDHHPALIANCMRNIVDYFFGFVEKLEYTSVFQKPALKDNRFQAFSRYMNRESHSFGQNIYDLKEFDYAAFKDGLRLVFEESGYTNHYNKMSKI